MIELRNDELVIRFTDVHEDAISHINFQRTLRIPDDGNEYPLPAGMGRFPLDHIEDYQEKVPSSWLDRGGVLMPMYQSEALWICFNGEYPMAIKIAAGKINAVSGGVWGDKLVADPQDYIVSDEQPWLDGFCVKKGLIRQFVAMPLGEGYSAEEQLTGKAESGGIQIIAYPMKAQVYEQVLAKRREEMMVGSRGACIDEFAMGLAPGGLMKQEVYEDFYGIDAWDTDHGSRCFVHLVNSEIYELITGRVPPQPPISKKQYSQYNIPWFDYYADGVTGVEGSGVLDKLKSIAAVAKSKDETIWDNQSVNAGTVKVIDSKSVFSVVSEKDF